MTKQNATRNAADNAKDVAAEAKNTAAEATNTAADVGNEVAERTVVGMKEASARAVSIAADTQKSLGDNVEKFSKRLEGLSSFNQQNMEAFAKSSEIAAKALEGIGSEVAAFTRKSYEDRVAAARDFASARTMAELFEKQATFAQTAFEGWVQQATRMSEIYASAAKDISEPIGQRVAAAGDEVKRLTL